MHRACRADAVVLVSLLVSFAACADPEPAEPDDSVHRLTVTIEGAGSVVGSVRSEPPGIDCVLDVGSGGRISKTCSAEFAAGTEVELTFVPDGASQTAQFHLTRDASSENCAGEPAAVSLTCNFVLDVDAAMRVFPLSVPPP
jgi:hypothetical protein